MWFHSTKISLWKVFPIGAPSARIRSTLPRGYLIQRECGMQVIYRNRQKSQHKLTVHRIIPLQNPKSSGLSILLAVCGVAVNFSHGKQSCEVLPTLGVDPWRVCCFPSDSRRRVSGIRRNVQGMGGNRRMPWNYLKRGNMYVLEMFRFGHEGIDNLYKMRCW